MSSLASTHLHERVLSFICEDVGKVSFQRVFILWKEVCMPRFKQKNVAFTLSLCQMFIKTSVDHQTCIRRTSYPYSKGISPRSKGAHRSPFDPHEQSGWNHVQWHHTHYPWKECQSLATVCVGFLWAVKTYQLSSKNMMSDARTFRSVGHASSILQANAWGWGDVRSTRRVLFLWKKYFQVSFEY